MNGPGAVVEIRPEPRRHRVSEELPKVMTRAEVAKELGYSLSRFDELRKAGTHPAIVELLPSDGHPKFQGAAVQRWIDQKSGRPEPRFLKSARAQRGTR